ncbi:hypothetical protein K1T71_009123 [Dendrolimus kikuchii]|uniref:Uncharacterized protein n=1 Tax=Dendrolimus kikuchii TaxID=765133 RepID=A0ACC1CUL4_9NEOP|nr:hypothetical protein K1T71_009123 [Dendrolimus kikuchii]
MEFVKISNWLLVSAFLIYSDATIEVKSNNSLQNTNSRSHARFKRYDYPRPQASYNYQQNQADISANGYHYDKPETNIAQVGGPSISAHRVTQQEYESTIFNGPRFNEPQMHIPPNVNFNQKLLYTRLRDEDYLRLPDPQRLQQNPNQNVNQINLPLTPNIEERFATQRIDDDQGAFISSDIFGVDFDNQNFSVSPTGLLIPKPTKSTPSVGFSASGIKSGFGGGFGGGFSGGTSISCDKPYQKPPMPTFRNAKRTSERKCAEYIWELRIRSEIERRNKQCESMRTKRSLQSWPQQSWPQQNWPQIKRPRVFGFHQSWSEQNWHAQAEIQQHSNPETIWSQQSLYDQTERSRYNSNSYGTTEQSQGIGAGFGIAFQEAKPEEFPHMTALGWRGVTEEYVFKCGGSLISRNFVLTAAHCTASAPDPTITDVVPRIVRIGDTNIGFRADGRTFTQKRRRRQAIDPGRLDVSILDIIKPIEYDPNMRYFDIALLRLEYQLEFNKHLQPACLWTDPGSISRVRKAVATGWGIVDLVTSRTTLDLQAGELDIIDTGTCNRLLRPSFGRKLSQVVDHQICAGKLSGGSDVCQGDSGGPLQVKIVLPIKDQGSMHAILGIISAGVGCARPDTPGIYTRVTSFLDWIERHVWP